MRYRAHMADSAAGRRRPQAQPHRLHGLERPRQRARPVAHLPAAGQGAASGRLPHPAQEGRQAGFRLLGRVRAEFRRPAHAVRERRPIPPTGTAPRAKACTSPRFRRGASGPYLPGAAIKGALRTGMVFAHWRDGMLQDVAGARAGRAASRGVRRRVVEEQALGPAGIEPHALRERGRFGPGRHIAVQDLPAAHLHPAASRRRLSRSAGNRARAAPWMARVPKRARRRSPKWRLPAPPSKAIGTRRLSSCSPRSGARSAGRSFSRARIFEAANVYAAGLLALQRQYACLGRHGPARQEPGRTRAAPGRGPRDAAPACSPSAGAAACPPRAPGWTPPMPTTARFCSSSRSTTARWPRNLPFPKTRRIVFLNNRPATLPGWVELAVEE